MKWWHRGYTKRWLDRQGFDRRIFRDPFDGDKLHLLDQLSFPTFRPSFWRQEVCYPNRSG